MAAHTNLFCKRDTFNIIQVPPTTSFKQVFILQVQPMNGSWFSNLNENIAKVKLETKEYIDKTLPLSHSRYSEPLMGVEPTTCSLRVSCSTTELKRHIN